MQIYVVTAGMRIISNSFTLEHTVKYLAQGASNPPKLNVSRLISLQLSLLNPLKRGWSRQLRCSLSITESYIWVINKIIAYQGSAYIRDVTVRKKNTLWTAIYNTNSWTVNPVAVLWIQICVPRPVFLCYYMSQALRKRSVIRGIFYAMSRKMRLVHLFKT